ncbi:polyribonucleotide nucleotidyltransferase [Oscillospiraceae bacterium MB08-C2-2]|nr:polyribonucleotide nucleotidyltransferase [Oscillospiraceae bacterium MB08-C2-2]
MFDNFRVFETELAGRKITFETGKMCGLSNGSCLVRYGETTVLVNATLSEKPRDGIDFFPLSVDYEEKLYSVGKIPGSFMRRESRPSETAILASRLVDRPIRPLFPAGMRNDCTVVMTVMSTDLDYSPEIAGMIGTSFALSISDIPWNGPIAGVNVGLVDDELILNPTFEQRQKSRLNLTVAGTADKVCMIEAGADQVPENVMMDAIKLAHSEIQKIVAFISKVQAEIGKPKLSFEPQEVPHDMFEAVKSFASDKIKYALDTDDKTVREARLAPIVKEIHEEFDPQYPEQTSKLDDCVYKLQKYIVRRWLLDEQKRVDGRGMNEIRPLDAQVGLIPRVHGSGMFTRGQTQVLTIATLGPVSDAQMLDGVDGQENRRYMHHYNFPSYSVGETRPSRGPGRREIGHGALAQRALEPVLPDLEDFPYAYRLVSEVLSSNGSTSQGSICGSTLALMDAGVPIKAPVAGISCGLITEGDRWMTMVDIQGLEDFFGDMDFKVGGTHNGITAIQMDIKLDGLTYDIIEEAFEKCRKARLYILDDIMLKAIPTHREELSTYAPKMLSLTIHPDKIREVIGSGGKVIQRICAECDVKIDIEDSGKVFVSGINIDNARRAVQVIRTIAEDPEVGAFYKGKVTRLMNFGAFVEIAPGKEGLVHISKLDMDRVEKVEDVVSVGDEVLVKVTEIDQQGRINLSRKDALIAMEAKKKQAGN